MVIYLVFKAKVRLIFYSKWIFVFFEEENHNFFRIKNVFLHIFHDIMYLNYCIY